MPTYKEIGDSVNVVYFGGWCVMVPWNDDELNGARTEIRCNSYQEAVFTARQRKVSLSCYLKGGMDFWEAQYKFETNDFTGEKWQSVVKQIMEMVGNDRVQNHKR